MSRATKPEVLQKNLEKAIQQNNVEKILNLVRNENVDVNSRDIGHDLLTTLMKVCYLEIPDREIVNIINEVLERDPEMNIQDSLGRTAIMHACISGKHDVVDCLISDPDSRIDIFDFDGNSALMYAVKTGSVSIVKRIMDHPGGLALLDVYDTNGMSPLTYAKKKSDPKLYKLLSSYQKNFPKNNERQHAKTTLPPPYSPRLERLRKKGKTPPDMCIERTSPKSIYIDDETNHSLSLSTPKLKRRNYRSSDAIACEQEVNLPTILRTISSDTGENCNSPLLSRLKERRNSLSLPDLRNTSGCLVASGENTPAYPSSSDGYSSEEGDDSLFGQYKSPRKPVNRQVKKCVSENQITFPKIKTPKNKQLQRTMTDTCVFGLKKKDGGGTSKKIHIPSGLI
ncbi:ankyrin repeat domain-containing protein 34C-like [Argopecten irradians]|uniref:ankyrin repeat domain-containing protein 34C-like n=1 Tax=Argopecten irradians TaxID=31199 RepID=UPI00371FE915